MKPPAPPDKGDAAPPPSDGLRELGRAVRERRERLGWSQTRLAAAARLSRGTLKNLEEALRTPHPDTLEALSRVPELRLGVGELQALLAPPPPPSRDALSNLYVDLDPKCDTLVLVRELMDRMAAPVAHIPQTYMYIDPKSADCWCAMAGQASYLAHRDSIPMAQLAAAIADGSDGDLDVIALGCGDARDEVRLVQHLRQHLPDPQSRRLRLFLLDISPPLLGHAHRHAVRTLADCPGVEVAPPIHGDFFRLPRYRQLLPGAGPPRRRVVCMLGNTFGNLDNELNFVHEGLGALPPGDLFLLQVTEARAPAAEPAQIHALDPRLSGQLTPELQQIDRRWLLGIVESYVPEATLPTTRLSMYTQLNMRVCPVPGSYAVETIVEMRVPGEAPRRFSMEYIKRYDAARLDAAMGELGWDLGAAWSANHWLLHLYRRGA